jgi:hypothetical protein
MITAFSPVGQLGAGGGQPCPADGHQQRNPAAAQQQRGQCRLSQVVRYGVHGQLVWQ